MIIPPDGPFNLCMKCKHVFNIKKILGSERFGFWFKKFGKNPECPRCGCKHIRQFKGKKEELFDPKID